MNLGRCDFKVVDICVWPLRKNTLFHVFAIITMTMTHIAITRTQMSHTTIFTHSTVDFFLYNYYFHFLGSISIWSATELYRMYLLLPGKVKSGGHTIVFGIRHVWFLHYDVWGKGFIHYITLHCINIF